MMNQRVKKQLILAASIVFFAGSAGFSVAQLYAAAIAPSSTTPTPASTPEDSLQAQANGYELVLKREPTNQTALEGLVTVRLQLQDYQGAIAPLEELVKLHPDNSSYTTLLAEVSQQAGDRP